MRRVVLNTLLTILFLNSVLALFATEPPIMATLHGVVKDGDGTPLPYTTIYKWNFARCDGRCAGLLLYGLSENSRRNNRKIWMFIEHPYFLLSKYKVYRGYQAGKTCEVVPL